MDEAFVLTLASQSWLKWFSCPQCGSDYTISKNGRCTECDEPLVLVRSKPVACNIRSCCPGNLNFLIPWQPGPSFYYHNQWNQLPIPIKETHNS